MAEKNSLSAPLHGAVSDEGYVNKKNEDDFCTFKIGPGEWQDEPGKSIYVGVVADGVTSTSGGAQASKLTVETLKRSLSAEALGPHEDETTIRKVLGDAIQKTNRQILEEARQNPEWGKMSTTLVLAAVANGRLFVAHLGDSRAYLLRGQEIYRLTLDHTWGQEALEKKLITQDELNRHANRNVIRRFLGIKPNIEIDWQIVEPGSNLDDVEQRILTKSIEVYKDDVILLCSDGLTDKVQNDELIKIISKHKGHPQSAAKELIQLAIKKKEQDNVTALLLSFAKASKGATPLPSVSASSVASGSNLTKILAGLLVAAVLAVGGWFIYTNQSSPTNGDVVASTATIAAESSNGEAINTAITPNTGELVASADVADDTPNQTTTIEPVEVNSSVVSTSTVQSPRTVALSTTPISSGTVDIGVVSPNAEEITPTIDSIVETIQSPEETPAITPIETVQNAAKTQSPGSATPTRRPTSAPTPTITPTYTSIPTYTPEPTSTPRSSSTSTPQPVSTSTATQTPTVLSTPTASPSTTSTSRAPSSPQGSARPTPTPLLDPNITRGNFNSLLLLSPEDGANGKETNFCWTTSSNFSLRESDGYELIFWGNGQSPEVGGRGLAGATKELCSKASRDTAKSVGLPMNEFVNWAVRRVILSPYQPKELLSETRTFRFDEGGSSESSPSCSGPLC